MNPAMIVAIGNLLAEAAAAGVQINDILESAKATGKVPPEQWAAVRAAVDRAESEWRDA